MINSELDNHLFWFLRSKIIRFRSHGGGGSLRSQKIWNPFVLLPFHLSRSSQKDAFLPCVLGASTRALSNVHRFCVSDLLKSARMALAQLQEEMQFFPQTMRWLSSGAFDNSFVLVFSILFRLWNCLRIVWAACWLAELLEKPQFSLEFNQLSVKITWNSLEWENFW